MAARSLRTCAIAGPGRRLSADSTALFSAARARPRIHTQPSGRIASSARPNLRAVQELLGHAWVTTTQRYTHLEIEDLQAQVAEMPANRPTGAC
jgi:integrase